MPTKLPSTAQMKARCNDYHAAILREVARGQRPASGKSSLDIKARSTARGTLFRWGCLELGPVRRDERLRTSYPTHLSERGIELLRALDPVAGAFAGLARAERNLTDFRELRAALEIDKASTTA